MVGGKGVAFAAVDGAVYEIGVPAAVAAVVVASVAAAAAVTVFGVAMLVGF